MTEDERNRAELVAKVRALASAKGVSPVALFARYDANGAGQLDRTELTQLLSDANVGNVFTRGAWVAAVFDQLDKDRSGGLTRAELDGVLAALEPPPPVRTAPAPSPSPSSALAVIGPPTRAQWLAQLAAAVLATLKAKGAKYDRKTVAAFQVAAGIPADGIDGPKTAAALRAAGAVPPPVVPVPVPVPVPPAETSGWIWIAGAAALAFVLFRRL